jgi:archaellum component FlaF (FlaF/FlaG flagellin family)
MNPIKLAAIIIFSVLISFGFAYMVVASIDDVFHKAYENQIRTCHEQNGSYTITTQTKIYHCSTVGYDLFGSKVHCFTCDNQTLILGGTYEVKS